MKILLAPSESKKLGGDKKFNLISLFFQIKGREKLYNIYTQIIDSNNFALISKIFGLKKQEDIIKSINEFKTQKTLKAIKRYSGVAFKYLDYDSLDNEAKNYIDNNVIIFSNLFGALRANDNIPYYKLKQGQKVGTIEIDKFYKPILKEPLDSFLENEDILDLRAKYYEKFYKPSKKYTTLKFIKNKKVVSHYAKAYRGLVLKEVAINNIKNIEEFLKLKINNLEIIEIIEKKAFNEIIFNIIE